MSGVKPDNIRSITLKKNPSMTVWYTDAI